MTGKRARKDAGDASRGEKPTASGGGGLTDLEVAVLHYLAAHAGQVVSREELLREVWGLDPRRTTTRTVDMHMAKLRSKLRGGARGVEVLRTVRGRGYTLAANRVVGGKSNVIQQGEERKRS
jgi:DNA-binding response OmpR family regulator